MNQMCQSKSGKNGCTGSFHTINLFGWKQFGLRTYLQNKVMNGKDNCNFNLHVETDKKWRQKIMKLSLLYLCPLVVETKDFEVVE